MRLTYPYQEPHISDRQGRGETYDILKECESDLSPMCSNDSIGAEPTADLISVSASKVSSNPCGALLGKDGRKPNGLEFCSWKTVPK